MPREPLDRRDWMPELAVLVATALLATLVFATTPLDLAAARLFYRPGSADPWPLAHHPLFLLLYGAAPWVTASLVLLGFGILTAGLRRREDRLLRHGVLLLLAIVVGPGLVVNALFKDHWHRPRPRDVVALGGTLAYVPPLARGAEGGGSFPCGHCSVGFLYGIGWWLWKGRRPALGRSSLLLGLLAGLALGLGRMAAGGHFLSDVVWSALLALAIVHALYHYVLRIPAHERALAAGRPSELSPALRRALTAGAVLGGLAVLVALFATPHGTAIADRIPLGERAPTPRLFALDARHADVELVVVDAATAIVIRGELHGFGLPTSRLETRSAITTAPVPAIRYRVVERGWFTDLDCQLRVEVPATLERVTVRIGRGNMEVRDVSRAQVVRSGRLRLELATGAGHVHGGGRGGAGAP